MTEFMMVQTPAVYPQACVFCQGAKGPLVDTFASNALGRMYCCALCGKRIARQLGLIKGDRMEQLMNHGALLDQAAKALAEREQLVEQQMAELASRARKIDALEELLQQERAQTTTLRHWADTVVEGSKQMLNGAAG